MKQQLKMQAGSIAPPMSIEEVKAMLDTTEKGGVRNSIKNCLTVFQHDPLLLICGGKLCHSLLKFPHFLSIFDHNGCPRLHIPAQQLVQQICNQRELL